ncbi:serine/threonine dehydratase [Pilimelia terevasa]|uniref:threonine ammonia-lyase n=1 Tax=Pilimelia terevasa TaxID=53372 RepID=A0A8J3FM05_9ACTN|nr:pyridoxal-phosphate dependent enzyme [Pilimelia terevasa]GGK41393.1 serine/threonine dehydratase [Pilimelia terevasa]
MRLIEIDDVRDAAQVIEGEVVRTPLLRADESLWLKPENLQPTGAFKLRGATYALSRLSAQARRAGVVTHSSGNHAYALAHAAARYGTPMVAVMPEVTTAVKREAVRARGAQIVLVPAAERESRTAALAAARGLTVVPPYDHPDVIAGQGTVGLEIVADLPDVDVVLVPVGGGGLSAGVATAVAALRPSAKVIGVEPALAADAAESLRTGTLCEWPVAQRARTSAEGLRGSLSALTLAHLRARLDRIVTVTEDEIAAAVPWLAARGRVVAEPSGAVATAAYLHHRSALPPGRTVAVVSGGNVDPAAFAAALRGGEIRDGAQRD